MIQSTLYIGGGLLLAAYGVTQAFAASSSGVTYRAVEGISAFAVLYVIAQGVERATELVVNLLSLLPSSPHKKKNAALREVRAANSTLNGNPTFSDFDLDIPEGDASALRLAVRTAADAKQAGEDKKKNEAVVEERRRDIAFLALGLSIALSAVAVRQLNYGLLVHIGAENVNVNLDRLLTVLAAAGGTKALHELIGRLQKAKESAEAGESS